MNLYNIYSLIHYNYVGVTDERNALAVDPLGWLDVIAPTPFF
jgi:hypothetical protein